MNKKRIIELLEILQKETDIDHQLSLKEIISKLEEKDIYINNRKTLYTDFKYLSDNGYEIEYNDGKYYLTEAPFTLSEIKIIIDSLNSLKNLDDKFLNDLKDKIYSFISKYEVKYLKNLEYHKKHSSKNFIHRLEDTLQAIKDNKVTIIKRVKHEQKTICPIFLYRQNDYYYLYYHYLNNNKIYHVRFDNIEYIKLTEDIDSISISKDTIIKHIQESTNAYYSDSSSLIEIEILDDSEYLRSRLLDEFENIIFTKKGFSFKASVNEALFSKLVSFNTSIRIIDKKIAKKYKEYLNNIIHNN